MILIILCFPASAYEIPTLDESIPKEVKEYLPGEIIDNNSGTISMDKFGSNEVLKYLFNVFKDILKPTFAPFFTLIGIIISCSVFSNFSQISSSSAILKAYTFLSSLCLGISMAGILSDLWKTFESLMEKLTALMNGISISMVTVYAISGNVNESAVSASNMTIFVAIVGNIFKYGLFPVLQICFVFALISAITELSDLTSLAATVRKTYTTVLVFIMGILTTVLSVQHVLAAKSDGMLVRGVKMAFGSFIPIVGNAIGEASRTVAAGLNALKGSLGAACMIALAVCVIPLFVRMFVIKLSFMLCSVLSDILGMKRESGFIKSCGEIINFAIALLSSVTLVFTINLMIFARSEAVLGV